MTAHTIVSCDSTCYVVETLGAAWAVVLSIAVYPMYGVECILYQSFMCVCVWPEFTVAGPGVQLMLWTLEFLVITYMWWYSTVAVYGPNN